ncbi:MAG: transposase [Bacteroidota bacterium]|nr:transposase [Bacteroidota bacterium]
MAENITHKFWKMEIPKSSSLHEVVTCSLSHQTNGHQHKEKRAAILFRMYPDLKKAYELSMMFRSIYENSRTISEAKQGLEKWYENIQKYGFESFATAANSIKLHQETILAYFVNRSTNALAENFNSKIKAFRSVFRGINDIGFFIYRVTLIFA